MSVQLTLYGAPATAQITSSAGFTLAQREIMRLLSGRQIRSKEAGRIVHLHRTPPCRYCAATKGCQYASSDGNDAMRRLMDRGFANRVKPGLWERTWTN
jgi:hypothetical protein